MNSTATSHEIAYTVIWDGISLELCERLQEILTATSEQIAALNAEVGRREDDSEFTPDGYYPIAVELVRTDTRQTLIRSDLYGRETHTTEIHAGHTEHQVTDSI